MTTVFEHRRSALRLLIVLTIAATVALTLPQRADAGVSPERQMAALINKARRAAGRAPLQFNTTLSKYADRHSLAMARNDRLYHNAALAKWLRHMPWRILGENVGVGPSVAVLHPAFMASPAHRSNILDRRFRKVGVGVVVRDGTTWVTVIFYG